MLPGPSDCRILRSPGSIRYPYEITVYGMLINLDARFGNNLYQVCIIIGCVIVICVVNEMSISVEMYVFVGIGKESLRQMFVSHAKQYNDLDFFIYVFLCTMRSLRGITPLHFP